MKISRPVFVLMLLFSSLYQGCGSSTPDATDTGNESTSPIIRLFFFKSGTAVGDPATDPNPHDIDSATTTDGASFTQESGVRFEKLSITDPDVFRVSASQYILFASKGTQIIKATASTPDGTYTEDTAFNWDNGAVSATVSVGGSLKTFYCEKGAISVATYDAAGGTLSTGTTALSNIHGSGQICDPTVIQLGDGTYLMFYKWTPTATAGPSQHKIYSATSTDGVTYTATNTLIRDQASVPGAVRVGGKIYLYFVDGSAKLNTTGGVAVGISSDEGKTFSFQAISFDTAVNAVDPDPISM